MRKYVCKLIPPDRWYLSTRIYGVTTCVAASNTNITDKFTNVHNFSLDFREKAVTEMVIFCALTCISSSWFTLFVFNSSF